ncbi:MAG: sugar ABC transporter permease [Anaerolineae bacterium]|nr:sugar ABC transporter permease [Anaerolineae bacterium]
MASFRNRASVPVGATAALGRFSLPRLSRASTPYLFLLPAAAALLFIFFYPMARSVYVSFFNYDQLAGEFSYTGLQNYLDIVRGNEFWNSLRVSLGWVVGSVLGQFLVGFGFALLLHERWPGNRFVRALMLLPWVMPGVSIGLIWRLIYNPQFGMLNDILTRLGMPPQTWLADPNMAMFAVIVPNVWKAFPFVAVTMLAGLSSIPTELYEAAKVDGATTWGRFRFVTLPSMRNLILILTLLLCVWTFNFFDLPFVLTQGGPAGATKVMPILVYESAFEDFQYGYSSALAVVMTVINMVFAVFYLRSLRK